jgi:hypothetical protein
MTGADDGIRATNNASAALSISTTGAVTGGLTGIFARNNGTGALSITADGDVTGTNDFGIRALNFGAALSVVTGEGTTVTSNNTGISAINSGIGALTIIANGDVGTENLGIYAKNVLPAPVSASPARVLLAAAVAYLPPTMALVRLRSLPRGMSKVQALTASLRRAKASLTA